MLPLPLLLRPGIRLIFLFIALVGWVSTQGHLTPSQRCVDMLERRKTLPRAKISDKMLCTNVTAKSIDIAGIFPFKYQMYVTKEPT